MREKSAVILKFQRFFKEPYFYCEVQNINFPGMFRKYGILCLNLNLIP